MIESHRSMVCLRLALLGALSLCDPAIGTILRLRLHPPGGVTLFREIQTSSTAQ